MGLSSLTSLPVLTVSVKSCYDFNFYQVDVANILERYPGKVPVIVTGTEGQSYKLIIDKHYSVGEFIHLLRKREKLARKEALFMLTKNNTLPATQASVGNLYDEHADNDLILYLKLRKENTFG